MTRAVAIAASALLVLLGSASAAAQAWIRPPATGYVSLSYRTIGADQFYGADGEVRPQADYRQHGLSLYSEVGVLDRWLMVTFGGEVYRWNILTDQGATRGLGDLWVGAWTGLITDPVHLSLGVVVGLPTGDPSPSASTGADDLSQLTAAVLPTGDGETDVSFRLALGHSFAAGSLLQAYTLVELGYSLRTQGFIDQITYRAELGGAFQKPVLDRFTLIVRLSGVELLGDATRITGVAGLGDGISYTSPAAVLDIRIWRDLHVFASLETAVRATNLPAAPALSAGISYEIRPRGGAVATDPEATPITEH